MGQTFYKIITKFLLDHDKIDGPVSYLRREKHPRRKDMRKRKSRLGVIGIVIIVFVLGAFSQTADDLFQKALRLEKSEGKLAEAIELYQKVITGPSNKSLAAQAQLRIGMCYEKMGIAEAVKAYELVIAKYSDQAAAVAEAKARLAALRKKEPAGLTMTRLLPPQLYTECQRLSPDGSKVAGIVYDMPEAEGQNVAIYDLATRKLELITKYDYGKEARWAHSPVWSPDSRGIAFLTGSYKDSAQELWICNLAGQPRHILKNPNGGLVPCDWMPDGSAVVALLEHENNTFGLGLVSVKDGSFREVCPLLRTFDRRWGLWQASYSVDASPDGRLIAFSDGPPDGSRDIYVISVEGGSKKLFISHLADNREPRWSPDGRHIAFLNNRHGTWALWKVAVRNGQPDEPPVMILEGMEDSNLASWTEKGLLSSTNVFMNDIYILEIDPQSYVMLKKPQILDLAPSGLHRAISPFWSPDGRYLCFNSSMGTGESRERFFVVMSSDGGKVQKFKLPTNPVRMQGGFWEWMPDSSVMATVFWDIESHLFFSQLDMNTGEWKTRSIPAGEGFSSFNHAAWSSDGKAFFAIKPDAAGAEPGIILHELETGNERYLVRAKPGEPANSTLKASRDCKWLALTREDGVIILVDTDTGHVEKLEFGEKKELYGASWSPDGKHLVARGMPEGGGDFTELFIVSIPDSKFKSLDISRHLPRQSRILGRPDWSPDGRKIAFALWAWKSEVNLIQNLIPKK